MPNANFKVIIIIIIVILGSDEVSVDYRTSCPERNFRGDTGLVPLLFGGWRRSPTFVVRKYNFSAFSYSLKCKFSRASPRYILIKTKHGIYRRHKYLSKLNYVIWWLCVVLAEMFNARRLYDAVCLRLWY